MTNVQAAIGLAQMERIDEFVETRRRNAQDYTHRLRGVSGLMLPAELPDVKNVFWMYSVLVEDGFSCTRDELISRLRTRGIDARPCFIAVNQQPLYGGVLSDARCPV